MKVSKSDTLAGFPLIKIRDLLRPYRWGAITAEEVETALGISGTEAVAVLQAMADAGFIEPESEQRKGHASGRFSITALGSRLCVARFVKRITREYADAAQVYKTVMTRHLLDLGDRDRHGGDGLGYIQQVRDRKDMRVNRAWITHKGASFLDSAYKALSLLLRS